MKIHNDKTRNLLTGMIVLWLSLTILIVAIKNGNEQLGLILSFVLWVAGSVYLADYVRQFRHYINKKEDKLFHKTGGYSISR